MIERMPHGELRNESPLVMSVSGITPLTSMGSILGPMTIHSEELPHKDHILLDLARPQTGTSSRGA